MNVLRNLRLMVLAAAAAAGCSSGGGGGNQGIAVPPPDNCTIEQQNQFVNDVMRDIYFWVDELPDVDPASFESPEALLEALRFQPLDRFSSIRDAEADNAFFSASQFIGVGLGIFLDDDDRLFVTQVFSDGPAAAAGFQRGDEILAINGQSIPDIVAGEGIDAAFGPDEIGVPVDLDYVNLQAEPFQVTIEKALVTIEPVPAAGILDVGGRVTGYLAFRDFVDPAFDALASNFEVLAAQNVEELILDLRYNGGGLLSVAEFLGNLIGGSVTAGNVYYVQEHNANNAELDTTVLFQDENDSLSLTRVIVVTSAATASASELVINGLEAFVDVVLIGDTTFGKPVGSFGFGFCSKVIHPISFQLSNADGQGEYFDGFPPDCLAGDDLTHALGDPAEESLAEAIFYLENGVCSPQAEQRALAAGPQRKLVKRRLYDWRDLTGGAY